MSKFGMSCETFFAFVMVATHLFLFLFCFLIAHKLIKYFRCGKTTQVPQFIMDQYLGLGDLHLCNILCTQPRRISAIAVAERVADERADNLGRLVGYQIRMEKMQVFISDGTFLCLQTIPPVFFTVFLSVSV